MSKFNDYSSSGDGFDASDFISKTETLAQSIASTLSCQEVNANDKKVLSTYVPDANNVLTNKLYVDNQIIANQGTSNIPTTRNVFSVEFMSISDKAGYSICVNTTTQTVYSSRPDIIDKYTYDPVTGELTFVHSKLARLGETGTKCVQGNDHVFMLFANIVYVIAQSDLTSVTTIGGSGFLEDIAIYGNYLYICAGSNGLLIYNISNPAIPSLIATCKLAPFNFRDYRSVTIYNNGTRAIAGLIAGGFQIINIANKASPVLVSETDPSVGAIPIICSAVDETVDQLFVNTATNINSTLMYDISNEATPAYIRDYSFGTIAYWKILPPTYEWGHTVQTHYVLNGNGLDIFVIIDNGSSYQLYGQSLPVGIQNSFAYDDIRGFVFTADQSNIQTLRNGLDLESQRVLIRSKFPSVDDNTGALVVAGGAGIRGNLNVGGVTTLATTDIVGDTSINGRLGIFKSFGTEALSIELASGTSEYYNLLLNRTTPSDVGFLACKTLGIVGMEIDANYNVVTSGNISSDGYLQFSDMTAPANGADGEGRLYKKTGNDGLFWKPDSAGAEVDLTLNTTTLSTPYEIGSSLVRNGTAPDLTLKSLRAGGYMTFNDNAEDLIINCDLTQVTLASTGAGFDLVNGNQGADLTIRSLVAGSGIEMVNSPTETTIVATATTLASVGGAASLVSDGLGQALSLRSIEGANGITAEVTGDTVTISNGGALILERRSSQTISNNAVTAITWSNIVSTVGDGSTRFSFTETENDITVNVSGLYQFGFESTWGIAVSNTAGAIVHFVCLDSASPGSTVKRYAHFGFPATKEPVQISSTGMVYITAGQVVRAFVYQNSQGNRLTPSGTSASEYNDFWIRSV